MSFLVSRETKYIWGNHLTKKSYYHINNLTMFHMKQNLVIPILIQNVLIFNNHLIKQD